MIKRGFVTEGERDGEKTTFWRPFCSRARPGRCYFSTGWCVGKKKESAKMHGNHAREKRRAVY